MAINKFKRKKKKEEEPLGSRKVRLVLLCRAKRNGPLKAGEIPITINALAEVLKYRTCYYASFLINNEYITFNSGLVVLFWEKPMYALCINSTF